MKPTNCTLICGSNTEHLSQLYTGFGLLENAGKVNLKYIKSEKYKSHGKQLLTVKVNDTFRISYDVNDHDRIYNEELANCDLYFKRSFHRDLHERISKKIKPLGLNYLVYGESDRAFKRALWGLSANDSKGIRVKLEDLVRSNRFLSNALRFQSSGRHIFKVEAFEGSPILKSPPLIMFFARAWDPSSFSNWSPEREQERADINQQRAQCIRVLRREFGKQFVGGLASSEFTVRNFPDCVVDSQFTRKDRYIRKLRQADICIATSGLDGSIGWKFAEYVANSKAIVSEPLNYEVPGNLTEGKNYLSFVTTHEGVDAVSALFDDQSRRYQMMSANHVYYNSYLRPDVLVWNTLRHLTNIDLL